MVTAGSHLDRDFKYLAKTYPEDFVKLVFNSQEKFTIQHEVKEINLPQLRADNVY